MDTLPLDIVRIFYNILPDTRPLSATCTAFRAFFDATDGRFWRSRGVNRARLATLRTAEFVTTDRAMAADNLAVFMKKIAGRVIDPAEICRIATLRDSAEIFSFYSTHVKEPAVLESLVQSCVFNFAYRCVLKVAHRMTVVDDIIVRIMELRRSLKNLPVMEKIILALPAYNSIGVGAICSYVVAKYALDPHIRAAAIEDFKTRRPHRKIASKMAELAPGLHMDTYRSEFNFLIDFQISAFVGTEVKVGHRHLIKFYAKVFQIRRKSPEQVAEFSAAVAEFAPEVAAFCTKIVAKLAAEGSNITQNRREWSD